MFLNIVAKWFHIDPPFIYCTSVVDSKQMAQMQLCQRASDVITFMMPIKQVRFKQLNSGFSCFSQDLYFTLLFLLFM